ncbi:hypothetical protein [Herbaspirillum sp. 1130]|uniref:hypothetical protein n=1 Tax=Herbaspirillum sp. 1130 TaxID=2806562 RepID=UPI001AE7AD6C|nr:hypothetical protein [Herbaspirillum sp. 1130]MBP1314191.1 hypothetical protein [Herbaspirillum sp. 1130]
MQSLTKFLKINSIAAILCLMFFGNSAYSFTPFKYSTEVKVSFAKGSSVLSDSVRVALARHLPRIFSLYIDRILIVTDGDEGGSKLSNQMLAEARSQALRQFFVDAGVPAETIFTKVVLTNQGGNSILEYVGTCAGGGVTCPYCVSDTTLLCKK